MRAIQPPTIVAFSSLLTLTAVAALGTAVYGVGALPLGDFRGVAIVVSAVFFMYAYAVVVYRVMLARWPMPTGEVAAGSRAEHFWNLYQLFFLVLFFSVIRSHAVPVPLTRLVYLALGARLGPNTYAGGCLMDPTLTTLGRDCIVGHDSVLFAHVIEGDRLALHPIVVGDGVTIGAHAVVMPGVTIGDRAVVSVGAVVTKGSAIGAGEIWGGTPARRLK